MVCQDAKEDPMEEEVKFAMMKRIAMFFPAENDGKLKLRSWLHD